MSALNALWKTLRGDSAAVVLVVVVIAYTYLKVRGIDDLSLLFFLGAMLVWRVTWGPCGGSRLNRPDPGRRPRGIG